MSDHSLPELHCSVHGTTRLAFLLRQLHNEKANGENTNYVLDKLQYFISNREDSELKGLEEKLNAVGRSKDFRDAERDLQWFEETLDRYTHFQSAQQVLLYFIIKIVNVFESRIMPDELVLTNQEVRAIIDQEIIKTTLAEMDSAGGHHLVLIDESDIKGMINWLAERCHIRWQAC